MQGVNAWAELHRASVWKYNARGLEISIIIASTIHWKRESSPYGRIVCSGFIHSFKSSLFDGFFLSDEHLLAIVFAGGLQDVAMTREDPVRRRSVAGCRIPRFIVQTEVWSWQLHSSAHRLPRQGRRAFADGSAAGTWPNSSRIRPVGELFYKIVLNLFCARINVSFHEWISVYSWKRYYQYYYNSCIHLSLIRNSPIQRDIESPSESKAIFFSDG